MQGYRIWTCLVFDLLMNERLSFEKIEQIQDPKSYSSRNGFLHIIGETSTLGFSSRESIYSLLLGRPAHNTWVNLENLIVTNHHVGIPKMHHSNYTAPNFHHIVLELPSINMGLAPVHKDPSSDEVKAQNPCSVANALEQSVLHETVPRSPPVHLDWWMPYWHSAESIWTCRTQQYQLAMQ